MTTLATLPTELIELICGCVVNHVRERWEFDFDPQNIRHLGLLSRYLSGLPLIHSRWTVPGQKALYRFIILPTAHRYKAFQDSLTAFPHNGLYVREIFLHWGSLDFGGPDGYSYKVLGWFHEMEIQQLVRLCPLLEIFHPGEYSPVIGQEGIAALGNIDSIRAISWRPTEFQQYGDAVDRAQSGWNRLDTLEIMGKMRAADFRYVQPVSDRLRTLRIHENQKGLASHFASWSLKNLQELDLPTREFLPNADITRIIELAGSRLITLTIPYPSPDQLEILATVFKLTPRLRNLRIAVGAVLSEEDGSEQLQVRGRLNQPQTTPFQLWCSKSLRSVRFELSDSSPIHRSIQLAFDIFMLRDAFPNLRKLLRVQRDLNGELQVINIMSQKIGLAT